MGQASLLVNTPMQKTPSPPPPSPAGMPAPSPGAARGGIIARLREIVDDVDLAISTKEHDLMNEGHALSTENHFKLGVLRGANALIRRAYAILEDYGRVLTPDTPNDTDLDEDMDLAIAAKGGPVSP